MADPTLSQLEALLRGIQSDVPQELASDFDALSRSLTATTKSGTQNLAQIKANIKAFEQWEKAVKKYQKTADGSTHAAKAQLALITSLTAAYSKLSLEATKAAAAQSKAAHAAKLSAAAAERAAKKQPRFPGEKGFHEKAVKDIGKVLKGAASDVPAELAEDFVKLQKALKVVAEEGVRTEASLSTLVNALVDWNKAITKFAMSGKQVSVGFHTMSKEIRGLSKDFTNLEDMARIAFKGIVQNAENAKKKWKRGRPQIIPPMWEGHEGSGPGKKPKGFFERFTRPPGGGGTTLGTGFGGLGGPKGKGPSKRTMEEVMKRLNAAWDKERKLAEDRAKLGKELGRAMKDATKETTVVQAAWKRLRNVLREIGRKLSKPPGGGKGMILGTGFGALGGGKARWEAEKRIRGGIRKVALPSGAKGELIEVGEIVAAETVEHIVESLAKGASSVRRRRIPPPTPPAGRGFTVGPGGTAFRTPPPLPPGGGGKPPRFPGAYSGFGDPEYRRNIEETTNAVKKQAKAFSGWTEIARKAFFVVETGKRVFAIFREALDFDETIAQLDELNKKSLELGVSVETLSTLGFIAERQGTSLDVLNAAMGRLQQTMFMVGTGAKEATDAFSLIGVSVSELEKLDPGQQFLTVAQALAEIPDLAMRARLTMRTLGENKEILRFISALKPGQLETLTGRAAEIGAIITTREADKAAAVADAFTDLGFAINSFQRTILMKFADTLTELIHKLATFVASPAMDDVAVQIGRVFDDIVYFGEQFVTALSEMGSSIAMFAKIMDHLSGMSIFGVIRKLDEVAGGGGKVSAAISAGLLGPLSLLGGEDPTARRTTFADAFKALMKGAGTPGGPSLGGIVRSALVEKDIEKFVKGLEEQLDTMHAITDSEKERLRLLKEQRAFAEQIEAFQQRGASVEQLDFLREVVLIFRDMQQDLFDEKQMAQAAKWWDDIAKSAGDTTRAMERQTAAQRVKSPFGQAVLGARAERDRMEADLRALQVQMQEQMARMRRERGTLPGRAEERLFRGDIFQPGALVGQELLTPEQKEILDARATAIMQHLKVSLIEAEQMVEPFGVAFTRGLLKASIGFKTDAERIVDLANNLASTLVTSTASGFNQFFNDIISGTKKTSDAFKDMGRSIIQSLLQVAQNAAIKELWGLILGIVGKIAGGAVGAAATPMAEGGIVTRPTYGLVGEAGPEAVIPLNKAGVGFGGTVNNYVTINSQPGQDEAAIAAMAADEVVRKMRYSQGFKGSMKQELKGGL